MYDGVDKAQRLGKAGARIEEWDRRSGNRHVFTASAEVIEVSSGARFSARTTDLGPGGCFVDTTNPFPVGAKVRVTVRKGKNEFNTHGTVVYSQHGLGMGISFTGLDDAQREALDAWIHQTAENSHIPVSSPQPQDRPESSQGSTQRAALARLVGLMVSKGILTEAEGSFVLVDPVL